MLAFLLITSAVACSTDFDCSLNGVCSAGVCSCDVPWHGPACELLGVQPAPAAGPAYGTNATSSTQASTSWGGTALFINGSYHLYVAELANHCGLGSWTSASRCTHATSASPLGPFTFADVAVDVWCHNPHAVEDVGTGELFLFHIGNGTHTGSPGLFQRSHGSY